MSPIGLFLDQPLDLTTRHQLPPSSPLALHVRESNISPASSTENKEERPGKKVSLDNSFTHSPSIDMNQQQSSTDDDDSVHHETSSEILSDDGSIESSADSIIIRNGNVDYPEGSLEESEIINVVDISSDSGIPCLPTPSGRGRKRKMVTSTPSSSPKRAKVTTNNRSIKPLCCGKCGAPKKNHKLDNICPADFKKPNNSDARILEILKRYHWRDRVFPRDNLVPPFYYRVRWSVEGERELIPHKKLLDYCTQETLNTFNRRFCKDCGLDSGTNPETDHRFCPNKIRSTPPTKRTRSEPYIKKLVERHYWPDCVDRQKEESSFFKVEWSHPAQPDQPEYVPSSWVKKKQLDEYKSDLMFYFKKMHRL